MPNAECRMNLRTLKPEMKKTTNGFTLIELLIVIAIVGILAGLVSSAIVVVMKSATEKRIESNAERLKAAIVEYWHDMGRWPLPDNAKPKLEKSGTKKKDMLLNSLTGDDGDNREDAFRYVMVYSGNNGDVVNRLLETMLPDGQTIKTFIDLHGFTVPTEEYKDKWPALEVVDAFEAHEANKDAPMVLSYFASFVVCPHCKRYYLRNGATGCSYDGDHNGKPDCTYYEENEKAYKFTDQELSSPIKGALPYVIKFDLNNNVVDVQSDPSAFKFQQ